MLNLKAIFLIPFVVPITLLHPTGEVTVLGVVQGPVVYHHCGISGVCWLEFPILVVDVISGSGVVEGGTINVLYVSDDTLKVKEIVRMGGLFDGEKIIVDTRYGGYLRHEGFYFEPLVFAWAEKNVVKVGQKAKIYYMLNASFNCQVQAYVYKPDGKTEKVYEKWNVAPGEVAAFTDTPEMEGGYTYVIEAYDGISTSKASLQIAVKSEEPPPPGKEKKYYNVTFRVESLTGIPIEGAEIYLNDAYIGATSENGTLYVENIEEGTYSLRVTANGYEEYSKVITISYDLVAITLKVEEPDVEVKVNPSELWIMAGEPFDIKIQIETSGPPILIETLEYYTTKGVNIINRSIIENQILQNRDITVVYEGSAEAEGSFKITFTLRYQLINGERREISKTVNVHCTGFSASYKRYIELEIHIPNGNGTLRFYYPGVDMNLINSMSKYLKDESRNLLNNVFGEYDAIKDYTGFEGKTPYYAFNFRINITANKVKIGEIFVSSDTTVFRVIVKLEQGYMLTKYPQYFSIYEENGLTAIAEFSASTQGFTIVYREEEKPPSRGKENRIVKILPYAGILAAIIVGTMIYLKSRPKYYRPSRRFR